MHRASAANNSIYRHQVGFGKQKKKKEKRKKEKRKKEDEEKKVFKGRTRDGFEFPAEMFLICVHTVSHSEERWKDQNGREQTTEGSKFIWRILIVMKKAGKGILGQKAIHHSTVDGAADRDPVWGGLVQKACCATTSNHARESTYENYHAFKQQNSSCRPSPPGLPPCGSNSLFCFTMNFRYFPSANGLFWKLQAVT